MRRVSLSNHHCDRLVSRRALLRAGALTLGGMTLADLLRARAYAADEHRTPTRDTAVILLWLEGGPSHLETYDLKPDAPVEFRGEFAPIATNVTGLDVCEWLPGHARIADRFSLIRSIAHDVPDHRGRPMPILPSGTPIRELNG